VILIDRARPRGLYSSFCRAGDRVYSSGVVGRLNGEVIRGILVGPADVELGRNAARAATGAILNAADEELGGLHTIAQVISLTGYLRSVESFEEHAAVMDAASEELQVAFPDTPLPVRTTVGVASLPGGGAVEVAVVFRLRAA
jgi:enamine deaminase RidA (YjgF/YER057c/UK114 family)